MKFLVLSNRSRRLRQAAFILRTAGIISLVGIIGAGCSSDFSRFDADKYTASIAADKTPANNGSAQQSNPYPGDVDPISTSSIQGTPGTRYSRPPNPAAEVDASPATARDDQFGDASRSGVVQEQSGLSSNTYNTYNTYNTFKNTGTPAKIGYGGAGRNVKVDGVTTAAIEPARRNNLNRKRSIAPKYDEPYGWTGVGGTIITMRDGETLYNISKRYGVPVKELLKVNKIANADRVNAGQRIIIPTYIYSERAPISAPDNNPKTRAARAGTGVIDDQNASKNTARSGAVSTKRAVSLNGSSTAQYQVVSGDTLGAIAIANGVKTSDIMLANGLDNSNIRVGQKLIIPGKSTYLSAKTQNKLVDADEKRLALAKPAADDKLVARSTPKPYSKPVKSVKSGEIITGSISDEAPARSGIETFRWPATGRILSKFGDRRRGQPNEGIDISVPVGTSVKAAENGVVIYSDNELPEYGNMLLIRHDGGWVSAYAHNKTLQVKVGDKVRRGQIVAKSGRTGSAEQPMIHFELRMDSNPVNPQKYLR